MSNASDEDWELLSSFLPPDWKASASKTGALKGLRQDKSEENYLRILLMHLGCGYANSLFLSFTDAQAAFSMGRRDTEGADNGTSVKSGVGRKGGETVPAGVF